MPSHISIRSMTVNKGVVQITGVTSTKQTVAKLITQLKSMPGVTDVFVPSSAETKDGYGVITTNFSISFSFNEDIVHYLEGAYAPVEDGTVDDETVEGETVEGEVE